MSRPGRLGHLLGRFADESDLALAPDHVDLKGPADDRTNSFTEINEPSQERREKFSLRVDAELAVDRDEVISHCAGAEKHRPGDVGCTLTSNEPSHDLGLAN